MEKAYKNIDSELRDALHLAYDRIESYHQKLMPKTWMDTEANGTILGSKSHSCRQSRALHSWWKSCISQLHS